MIGSLEASDERATNVRMSSNCTREDTTTADLPHANSGVFISQDTHEDHYKEKTDLIYADIKSTL